MAVISSENRTCASESLLELYRSPSYLFTTSVNCIVPLISLFISICAIRKLTSQSIIQYSPRIMLIVTILFALCHQAAYFSFKADHLYHMLFKLADPCNLQHTSYECRFISIGTTTGNCGLALMQLAMSFDRILTLVFPKGHLSLMSLPGVILSALVFFVSFCAWFVLTIDDPLTGWLNHCGFYPSYSVDNFKLLLSTTLYITVLNFLLDVGVLWYDFQRETRLRDTYDVLSRFETRVSLKCTQAMFLIAVCQFVSNVLYSGLTWLLMVLGSGMSSASYSLTLSVIYTTPYACLLLPLLICKVLNYIKAQRTDGISSLLSQRHSLEEHMSMIKLAWR